MAARLLRHYAKQNTTANAWEAIGSLIPANRALVVSKITMARSGTGDVSVSLSIGAVGGLPGNIVNSLVLGPGEIYTEGGLIIPAGEGLFVFAGAVSTVIINVFGEEVDN